MIVGPVGAAEPPRHRILLVTGEDSYHDWRTTTPLLRERLETDSRLTVEVLDDLSRLRSADLSHFEVVVLHFKNASPNTPGREAFDQLRQFVGEGGGLVEVHFACGAFEEFRNKNAEMAGRVWFGWTPPPGREQHDPRGPFVVRIAKAPHPITAGMTDFTVDDELYTCLIGDAPITVLASAVSKVDGRSYPMAFTHEFGEGRVFLCTLGHDERALKTPEVGKLYRKGCAWAAGIALEDE